jgi:hypothetical protein
MTISHSAAFIFIHVHRTGGTTILNLLQQELGNKVRMVSQHGNVATSEKTLLEKHPNYFTFGFVRNPWDRMLSWYALSNGWNPQEMDIDIQKFENYLELELASAPNDLFFHYNQLDYFPELNSSSNPIKIYRFENFEKETNALFTKLGFKLFDIPVINGTAKKNYRDYYTVKSKALVAEKCKKDIEYFKYSF